MDFYKVIAEVPASYGIKTVFDRTEERLQVVTLHLNFEGWLGGDIMEISPVYFVTCSLAQEFEKHNFSGLIKLEQISVNKSENFQELYPNRELPCCKLLRINGVPMLNDFSIERGYLVISERVKEVLTGFNLASVELKLLDK